MVSTTPNVPNVPDKSPGSEYPPSRPGIRFVLCVAAVAISVIGFMAFQ